MNLTPLLPHPECSHHRAIVALAVCIERRDLERRSVREAGDDSPINRVSAGN